MHMTPPRHQGPALWPHSCRLQAHTQALGPNQPNPTPRSHDQSQRRGVVISGLAQPFPYCVSQSCLGTAGPAPVEKGYQGPEQISGGPEGMGSHTAHKDTALSQGKLCGDGSPGKDSRAPAPALELSILAVLGLRGKMSMYSSVLPPTVLLLPLHTLCTTEHPTPTPTHTPPPEPPSTGL